MHFKSALIVCVVYFLTSAWSVGLNSDQLIELNKLFGNHKKCTHGVDEEDVSKVVREFFGIKWKRPEINFAFYPNEPDSINLSNLLRVLAEKDKRSDNIKAKIHKYFDVNFFLDEFITVCESYDQPGYLNLQQLSEVFSYWETITVRLNEKIKELKIAIGGNAHRHLINAADFLLIMLEIKPVGNGITPAQAEKFGRLYEEHKTPGLVITIDPDESEKVFNELGITIDDELKLLFISNRPAEILLKDLILAAAERTGAFEEEKLRVISTSEVVYAINDFNVTDADKDGLLSPHEYSGHEDDLDSILKPMEVSEEVIEDLQIYLKKFDGKKKLNFAEFVVTVTFVDIHKSVEDPMTNDADADSD
ncbi:uncharacterized protein LOC126847748 [Adelges cooleyi]|uniref:uncharacterized protein LOC126847748 n=1 Tax=Adelges cooleyi TaxID=133065 RepID=UPI00217FB739|nr:uncharacterized protein LOC126847748 [Adelges cooleyi]